MNYRFQKHYRREEAESLLPQLRQWLQRLNTLRREAERSEKRITAMMHPGHDVGGDLVNRWNRAANALLGVEIWLISLRISIKIS